MWSALSSIPSNLWLFVIKALSLLAVAFKIKQTGVKEAEARQDKAILDKVGKVNAIRNKTRNNANSGKRDKRLSKFDR